MIYRFGAFEFEVESGQLRRQSRLIPLEPQPARVLAVLLAGAGTLVSREELREHVWGRDTHVDFDRGLAYCLSQVRAALGDRSDNALFIQTLPKRGYTFIAPVTVHPPLPPAPHSAPVPIPVESGELELKPAAMRRLPLFAVAGASFFVLLLAVWFVVRSPARSVLVAVSVFDNETGVPEYDRTIAGLSDLVVTSLTNLAPDRVAVIGNAEVLRRPRNIRNLKAVAEGTHANYVLLGQLQQGEQGLRFVTHFIRLSDMTHLKANRLPLQGSGTAGLEAAVVSEFERAVREHLLTGNGN